MKSERTIIHLDLDAFYCAVEELREPSLRGKPFAVGGRPETRGVVSSCSYAARGKGIRSAMPMARAVQLCPELIILPGRHREYGEKSRQVMEILRQTTILVEQISIDEAFLDVTADATDKLDLARSIQQRILKECARTSLPPTSGRPPSRPTPIRTLFNWSQAEKKPIFSPHCHWKPCGESGQRLLNSSGRLGLLILDPWPPGPLKI